MTTEKLLKFPCQFPIKIMGANHPNLLTEINSIIAKYCPNFNPEKDISIKHSTKGNYLAITANVTANSQEQLDNIYRSLNQHELIKLTI